MRAPLESPENMAREELLLFYPAYRPRLMASLGRLVGQADAEDLADETLLRALKAVDGFRGEAALGTWLHRIGVNLAHDWLRRARRDPILLAEPESSLAEAVADATDGESLERRKMSACVQSLLAELPAQQHDLLVQADILERTAPEIAKDAGIKIGNAKIRLHRARRVMRAALETHCDFHHREAGILCCTPKSKKP